MLSLFKFLRKKRLHNNYEFKKIRCATNRFSMLCLNNQSYPKSTKIYAFEQKIYKSHHPTDEKCPTTFLLFRSTSCSYSEQMSQKFHL